MFKKNVVAMRPIDHDETPIVVIVACVDVIFYENNKNNNI